MTPAQFAAFRAALTGDLTVALRAIFLELAGWREPDYRLFVGQARPLVLGAQRAMASATAAQIADRASVALSRPVAPPPVPAATREYLRRDVTVDEVYRRPFASVYTSLADTAPVASDGLSAAGSADEPDPTPRPVVVTDDDVRRAVETARARSQAERPAARRAAVGDDDVAAAVAAVRARAAAERAERRTRERLERAVTAGTQRLEQTADLDMQQTYAVAAAEAMQTLPPDARPTGWKRVLVGEVNCALCVVASTQRYRIKDLNPIHPACDCEIEPLFGEDERVIDPESLAAVHAAVAELTGRSDAGARAPDYRELLIRRMTPDHGELGPMLVHPRHRFRKKYQLPT